MLNVSVRPVPNQNLTAGLDNQSTQLHIYQLLSGLYMDVYLNNTLIIGGVICQNLNRIVRDLYLGFSGDFMWYDTQGDSDPTYDGLGTRYLLTYLSANDLPEGIG